MKSISPKHLLTFLTVLSLLLNAHSYAATPTPTAPAAPTEYGAWNIQANSLDLWWGKKPGAVSYNVLQDNVIVKSIIDPSPTTKQSVNIGFWPLISGQAYHFQFQSCDSYHQCSAPTPTLTVTTLAQQAPAQPALLKASHFKRDGLTLTWQLPSDTNDISYYRILQNGKSINTLVGTDLLSYVKGNASSATITSLDPNQLYTFQVLACNDVHVCSTLSDAAVVNLPTELSPPYASGSNSYYKADNQVAKKPLHILFVPISFNQKAVGTPMLNAEIDLAAKNLDEFWRRESHGQSGVASYQVTPTLDASSYPAPSSFSNVVDAGRERAKALGINVDAYNPVVFFPVSDVNAIPFGGLANHSDVVLPIPTGSHVNIPGFVHEMSHVAGMGHLNGLMGENGGIYPSNGVYNVEPYAWMGTELAQRSITTTQAGCATEVFPLKLTCHYDFDLPYNIHSKYRMGWVDDNNIRTIPTTKAGTYRLYDHYWRTPSQYQSNRVYGVRLSGYDVTRPNTAFIISYLANSRSQQKSRIIKTSGLLLHTVDTVLSGDITSLLDLHPYSTKEPTNKAEFGDAAINARDRSIVKVSNLFSLQVINNGIDVDGTQYIDFKVTVK
jgi:hypothetical protein